MFQQFVHELSSHFHILQSTQTNDPIINSSYKNNFYTLCYVLQGSVKLFIKNNIYMVYAGSLLLIPAYEAIDTIPSEPVPNRYKISSQDKLPIHYILIQFSPRLLEYFNKQMAPIDLVTMFHSKPSILPLSLDYKFLLETNFSRLLELNQQMQINPYAFPCRIMTQLLLLESLISIEEYERLLQHNEPETHQLVNSKVNKAIQYIHQHYTEDLSLTSIAEALYISPFYLSKIFKRCTHLSIIDYINNLRIQQAKTLLERSSYKVSDIAEAVGFSSNSHFTRTFKLMTTLSPSQYKKLYTVKQEI